CPPPDRPFGAKLAPPSDEFDHCWRIADVVVQRWLGWPGHCFCALSGISSVAVGPHFVTHFWEEPENDSKTQGVRCPRRNSACQRSRSASQHDCGVRLQRSRHVKRYIDECRLEKSPHVPHRPDEKQQGRNRGVENRRAAAEFFSHSRP